MRNPIKFKASVKAAPISSQRRVEVRRYLPVLDKWGVMRRDCLYASDVNDTVLAWCEEFAKGRDFSIAWIDD